jgi:hypothetical protein
MVGIKGKPAPKLSSAAQATASKKAASTKGPAQNKAETKVAWTDTWKGAAIASKGKGEKAKVAWTDTWKGSTIASKDKGEKAKVAWTDTWKGSTIASKDKGEKAKVAWTDTWKGAAIAAKKGPKGNSVA